MLDAILIDDEYYALEGLKMELEDIGGVRVIAMYEEGQKAIENIKRLRPDVVFLDIDMPEMDGLELFSKLLELSPETEIVFVTAYNEYAVEAFELNAKDYIVKPVRKERLEKTTNRLQKMYTPSISNRSISINCFGHLSINIDEKELDIVWRTKKVEELLAYLACGEGNFVLKNKIAEALWPDLDMKKSKSNFYLAYHYLKKQSKELGFEIPLESVRGKIRLKIEEVDVDIIKFKEEIKKLEKITDENIDCAEKVVKRYKGMLLDEHCYDWSIEQGQYYEIIYIKLLKKMVKYFKAKKDIDKENYYMNKLHNKL
ncbi:response regulator [Clostridiisalibacter paucivorans]|uniref:response regulator n=1 Tax=Clostridiisalibacter paucivorans TaxID=408753 RepID=UPI00047E0D67|nr:response regulator [Clostridiisalibacter paucivorans]